MKLLLAATLILLWSIFSNAQGLPDIVQTYSMDFTPAECTPNGSSPGQVRYLDLPPPGYDTAITSWHADYRMNMTVRNLSSAPGEVLLLDEMPGVYAIIDIQNGAFIQSTDGPYHLLPLYADLLPFETRFVSITHPIPYVNHILGLESMQFPNNNITFHCRKALHTYFDSTIPFRERHNNYFMHATLELIWQDLN